MDFVKKHNIKKIDYLKIDIENAEYYIFSDLDKDDYHQRLDWIKNNVKKLVVEIDSSIGRYLGKDREIHSNPQAQHFIDYVVPYLGGKTWEDFVVDQIFLRMEKIQFQDLTERLLHTRWMEKLTRVHKVYKSIHDVH